jgi:glc operon protein GlcG
MNLRLSLDRSPFLLALSLLAAPAWAQQTPAPPAPAAPAVAPYALDEIPEKMPFNVPYGAPISLKRAQAAIQAAASEAEKRGWPMNIALVDSGANLVAFARMDGAQIASIAISEHKARASAKFRRPTKVFEEGLQKRDLKYVATLDDAIASRGGIPIIEDGRLIGAIGCSGATGSQDEVVCSAGVAALNLAK